jgi:PAS domain S-box-containing protein
LADGSILWHGIIRDISATKKSEQLLLRHKFITDTARDGFWVVNSKGYVIEVNQAYSNMSGYSIAELKMMQVHQLEAVESADEIKQRIAELIRTGSQCFETQHRRKNGTVFDIEVSVNYLYETGECFAFFRDISKRKQIEATLKENLRLFAAIFNNASVAMAQASFTGEFLHVNEAFCRMIGYTSAEIFSQKMTFKQITYPDDLAADLVAVQEMLAGTKKQHVREKRYIHKDGHLVWIFISAQLVKDEAGNPLYLIAVMIDISERKQLELERETLYAELESIVQKRTQELELSHRKLELTTQHLRDLAFEVDLASEKERKQIAIEVHDELGQNLTALRMQIALLHYQERPQQNLPIDEMLNLVDQLIKQVRNVASNLYPIALDMGFKHALNWLVNQFSENTHIPCKLIIRVETVNFTQSVLIGLFRIIQESLTNVSRHAQASYVTVIVMRLTNNSLSLIIQDNGTGFDTKILNDHSHFGIFGMRERALSLHAQFEITSKIGHGTTIVLNIPDNHL